MGDTKKYYRNRTDIMSDQGIEVDENALWELKNNNQLVLQDDDQYITTRYNHILFEEAL